MDFLTGYILKPYEVRGTGEVYFTDGTNNDLMANQITCEAYGYTYDHNTGSCKAFRYNEILNRNIRNVNNKFNGPGNTAGVGSNFVQINGTNNTGEGGNTNCFISGSDNEIAEDLSNATVLGVGGKASSNGEITIGGGKRDIPEAEENWSDRKVSVVNLTGITEDNTATELTVNGEDGFINVNLNSIVGFEIYITRFENGEGSSGTAGNYSYRNIKGVVRIDNAGTMLFVVGFTRNIGKIGVNGTAAMVDTGVSATSPSITIEVSDRNNVTNIWSATVTLHELTSNITF
jgi:hypothetical protein